MLVRIDTCPACLRAKSLLYENLFATPFREPKYFEKQKSWQNNGKSAPEFSLFLIYTLLTAYSTIQLGHGS